MPEDDEEFVGVPEPDDTPLEPETREPGARLRTVGRVGARIGAGLMTLAVTAVVVAAAVLVPFPSLSRSVSAHTVVPVPTAQQVVCPGGLVRLSSSTGQSATRASSLGTPQLASGAAPGDRQIVPLTHSDAGEGSGPAAPRAVTTTAGGSAQRQLVGAAESQTIATSEFSGLASAACTPPSGDQWLAGGATTVGRTTLLLLTNPSDVPANVSLQIYGEKGIVTAPGMTGIAVAARGQRVLSLAGFAPNLASPVVHVTSRGGQIAAALEQSTVRGITPGGIDFVGAQQAPARTVVIPGVQVVHSDIVNADLGQTGYEDLQTTLRIYGTSGATSARITLLDESGKLAGKAVTAQLTTGTVTDLPLDAVADGSYTVLVTASSPLVASVRVSTAGDSAAPTATDFAWMTGAPAISGSAVITVAPGSTLLHLANQSSTSESVTLRALSGADIHATVGAKSATVVSVVGGTSYELTGASDLYAAVTGSTDGGITGYSVPPSQSGATPIRVYEG